LWKSSIFDIVSDDRYSLSSLRTFSKIGADRLVGGSISVLEAPPGENKKNICPPH